MSSVPAAPAGASRPWSWETRLCVLIFGLALALNVGLSSIGWDNTLIGGYQFRQIQTAITTDYFIRDGIKLNYETPVLGTPWEIPLELPLFQACVAKFVGVTGMDLDQAGRFVSWLFFLSALPACFLLLGRFEVPAPRRLLFLALLLLSPVYLFFSRGFLIESAALAFSCWFLLSFGRWLDRPRLGWFLAAAICGALAGTIKVTTFIVFLCAAFLLLLTALRTSGAGDRKRLWLRAAVGVSLPSVAAVAWVVWTAAIRRLNPETGLLEGHFGYWSFGDLALRLSPSYWLRTYRVWADLVVGEAGLVVVALYYCWLRGRYRWVIGGCLLAFLSGQLIFANLYWVHAHYFYASALFLVAALGFFICEFLDQAAVPFAARWLFVLALLGFELSAYHRAIFPAQKDNTPVPDYVAALKSFTAPDDILVIIGQDWDGMVPYYSGRRALMLVNGRENDFAAVQKSVSRIDPLRVGAVVIQGRKWRDRNFVLAALGSLNLGGQPLFVDSGVNVGLWVPEERQALVRDRFDVRGFPSLQMLPEENTTGKPKTIFARQIGHRKEFDAFKPRPIRAVSVTDFGSSFVDGHPVLNAHANTDLTFRAQPAAKKLTGIYGLVAEAYARADMSDGVEFTVLAVEPGGAEKVLFRRMLDPQHVAADRGPQKIELDLQGVTGELVLRTTGGPAGSVAYDWSYWGDVHIE